MATIEELNIQITAEASSAEQGIKSLVASLSGLKTTLKSLEKINVGSAFAGVKDAITGLKTAVAGLNGMDYSELERLGDALERFASRGGVDAANSVTAVVSALREMPSASNGATSATKKLNSGLKSTSKHANNSAFALGKFAASLKRIIMYRTIRMILKKISQAFRDGTNNIYLYSNALAGTGSQGAEFAKTMDSLATSSLYLKNTIGAMSAQFLNALAPALNTIISKLITAINYITMFFAALQGKTSYSKAVETSVSYADNMSSAAGSAKEINKYLAGFDELNVMSSTSGGGGGGTDASNMFEESPIDEKVTEVAQKVSDIIQKIKDNFDLIKDAAVVIGVTMLAWKVSQELAAFVALLASLGTMDLALPFIGLAAIMIPRDLLDFLEYLHDFQENGASLENISGMVSEFIGIVGDLALISGNYDIAGVLKIIQGVGECVSAIAGMVEEGVNWEDADAAIKGLTNVAIGIGLLTKNLDVAGWALAIQGLSGIITELAENWDAITQGNWENVDKVKLAVSAIELLGGIAIALGVFSKLNKTSGVANAATTASETAAAAESVSATTSKLTPKLVSIAKDLAIGILIIAELAVAAGLFVAAIWGIGLLLQQVIEAWKPVLDNGQTCIQAILLGTALLVGVGVVAAALGVATVASAGALPLAIGLGTAILVELAAAFVLFTESLVAVADELSDRLAPALEKLNKKLPKLKTNMSDFTDYMKEFGEKVVDYTDSMGKLTWNSIVDGFRKLFTKSPIKSLADSIEDISDDTSTLNDKLKVANPELETAIELMTDYSKLMAKLKVLTDENGTVELSTGMYTNLKDAGKKLVTGFVDGVKANASTAYSEITKFGNTIIDKLKSSINESKNAIKDTFKNMFVGINIVLPHFYFTGEFDVRTKKVPSLNVSWYANGGFPDIGELFVAREAGPELVGSMNGRAAVANNDQIVQGIANGVYNAMIKANANGGSVNNQIILDGKLIYSQMVDRNKREIQRTGLNPMLV